MSNTLSPEFAQLVQQRKGVCADCWANDFKRLRQFGIVRCELQPALDRLHRREGELLNMNRVRKPDRPLHARHHAEVSSRERPF